MTYPTYIRDLIYFDEGKAASIFSQLRRGLIQEIQSSSEKTSKTSDVLRANLGLIGSASTEEAATRVGQLESRILHHSLLDELERDLDATGLVFDLTGANTTDLVQSDLRRRLDGAAYVRCEGPARLEDFGRLREVAQKFNELNEFIAMSAALDSLAQTDEFTRLEAQLHASRLDYSAAGEGARKEKALRRVLELMEARRILILAAAGLEGVPEWLVDALSLWIDLFVPGRISLRVRPVDHLPDLEVIANLRQESFLDTDLNQFRLAYGAEPNRILTILGLVTSVPEREDGNEDRDLTAPTDVEVASENDHDGSGGSPADEQDASDTARRAAFEQAFRAMFPVSEELERFVRFADFPTVTVQPIAVYRRFGLAPNEKQYEPSIGARVRSLFRRNA